MEYYLSHQTAKGPPEEIVEFLMRLQESSKQPQINSSTAAKELLDKLDLMIKPENKDQGKKEPT